MHRHLQNPIWRAAAGTTDTALYTSTAAGFVVHNHVCTCGLLCLFRAGDTQYAEAVAELKDISKREPAAGSGVTAAAIDPAPITCKHPCLVLLQLTPLTVTLVQRGSHILLHSLLLLAAGQTLMMKGRMGWKQAGRGTCKQILSASSNR